MGKRVLVCGGAGYIGSHVTRLLIERGYYPVVIDNLTTGHRAAVPISCPYYQLDLRCQELLSTLLKQEKISTVFHFAAYSLVSESVRNPYKYYANNVQGTLSLLEAMRQSGIQSLIFSSSAAVYGNPGMLPIPEDHPTHPINPYGESKLLVERILRDYHTAYGFRSVALRYFNACGAWSDGEIGEDHRPETHLIPLILKRGVLAGETLPIFGHDYPTHDGTPVRDYIHISDLAEAHILALHYLEHHHVATHFNLGNERGYSVLQVVQASQHVTGHQIKYEFVDRRQGDPAELIAQSATALLHLGWKPEKSTLEEMIASAWEWHRKHPEGFRA
ncbi:UDP-glucose 4-epimerase GalE [bacterium]|nr:UDP-glucose 4-epimerase GalE [bacterium]